MTNDTAPSALDTMRPPANLRGKHVSWVLAAAMHLALAAFLIYGIQWQSKPPETVSVELVRSLPSLNSMPPAPTKQVKTEPLPEPPPVVPKPVVETPKVEVKPALVKPAPPPVKPVIALNEKPKPIEKEKPVPVVAATPPPNPFAKQLEEESKRLQTNNAANLAEKELNAIRATQANIAKQKLTDAWLSKIQTKVRGNVSLPPQISGNPESQFDVTLVQGGDSVSVLTVKLRKSSGNSALDAAIERAIHKSSPLPKPDSADVFQRELVLRYRPVEN